MVSGLDYLNSRQLVSQLQQLASATPSLARTQWLAQAASSTEIVLLELGSGTDVERASRPALLVVAGLEGNDLAGPMITVAWASQFLKSAATNAAVRQLLDTTTIYLVPRLNPDAADLFFSKPQHESEVSPKPVDDDHDGLADEDGPDDLNGDGLITTMRVEDPAGEYILDPADPRLLLKADKAKGEVGRWRLLPEGRDNDQDGEFNEDGLGGVNFNRNFPYNYKYFAPAAGLHPVSELETRALADFIIARTNIAVVFTFGTADNLAQPPKGDDKARSPKAWATRPGAGASRPSACTMMTCRTIGKLAKLGATSLA